MAGTDDPEGPDPVALARLQEEVGETQLPDPILRVLVSVCNRGSLTFAITIAQGGLMVAGVAVGVGTFMADLAASSRRAGAPTPRCCPTRCATSPRSPPNPTPAATPPR